MEARARIVAEADGRGGTRLAVLYGEPPLLPRRTGPGEVHLVGGAAGPLGGDRLTVEVVVGADASLVVRTVAASILLPGRIVAGTAESRTTVRARVAAGGRLEWRPEPMVACGRCDHVSESIVDLEREAWLVWREEIVCGRHGEECGDLRVTTTVRRGGAPLHRQDLAIGPRAAGWAGPAVLGGARAVGSLLTVDPAWATAGKPPARSFSGPGVRLAALPLAGPGSLVTAVAADAHALRTALDRHGASDTPATGG